MGHLKGKISIIAVLFLILGCVSRPIIPPGKGVISVEKREKPLQGKVIVIDPGHGGTYKGAIGKQGLTESEINLGVALYLWGFLKGSGAEVILTRTIDSEVAQGEASGLKDDLQARCTIANQANANLFISIHHNSDWGDPERNEIQVYYQMADLGPSFDLALEVGVSLLEAIGPREIGIIPGNYYVLRNIRATAILGEASFLSHEEDEEKLAFFRSLREEALAYYRGIRNYLTKGVPQIYGLKPDQEVLANPPSEISGYMKDAMGIDPRSISMILDGRSVEFSLDPVIGKISHCPKSPLSNSQHSFRIEGRNRAGNAAKAGRGFFTVNCPPDRITLSLSPADNTGVKEIEVEVLDKNALPVIDDTPVEIWTKRGKILASTLFTHKGKAKTYLIADSTTGKAKVTARCGKISTHTRTILSQPSLPIFVVQIRNRHGKPIGSVEVSIGEREAFTDPSGYAIVEVPPINHERKTYTIGIAKSGYRTLSPSIELTSDKINCREFTLESENEGILDHKKFILDPELGLTGIQEGTLDPEKVTEWNEALARGLKEWFEAADATCNVTTEETPFPTVIDRLLFSSEKKGDYFITVRHQEQGCSVGYYFKSEIGERLARSVRDSIIQTLGVAECRTVESSEFTIVHTEMPSILISLPLYSLSEGKDRDETMLKETSAIYQGIIQFFKSSIQK